MSLDFSDAGERDGESPYQISDAENQSGGQADPSQPPVSAFGRGGDTVYTYPDGSQSVFQGGTHAWRNNNPGNVEDGDFARNHGAIGGDGKLAIFPDVATGDRAMRALLKTGARYRDASISAAIETYAPRVENDTVRYRNFVMRALGVDGTTLIRELTLPQFETFVSAMKRYEGWRPGRVVRYKSGE